MMDVNKLMSYIDNLTPQQAGGYLSGQTPFPYSDMPRELWAPRMAAAAHQKLAAGGLVNRMSDRMQQLVANRYFGGGQVQRFAEGDTVSRSKYGYVLAFDAAGNQVGVRKDSDPPLPNEASTKPAGMYAASDAAQPSMFTSPEAKRKYMEDKNKAAMTPINMARDAAGGFLDLIGMNTKPRKPDEAGLKEAIAKGEIPQQPQEQKDANAKFMAEQGPANAAAAAGSQLGAGVRGVAGMPEITMPAARDASELEAELKAVPKAKTDVENIAGIKSVMPADRTKERMARLEKAQKGLGADRERDMWLSILQGAGASMASGNRSFLGSLGTTVEKGAAGAAAADKDYRTRKAGLEEKQIKIEDASDAMARDIATQGMAMTKEQRKEYLAAQVSKYGLSKDQFDNAVKLAELKLKQFTANSEASLRASQAEYYKSGGRGAAGNAFTAEDKTKMILAEVKNIMKDNPGINPATAQEMARLKVEQAIQDAMALSGQGGGTDLVDTLPKGATIRR